MLVVPSSWLAGRWRSFRAAGRGIAFVVRTQKNARIHAAITAGVIGAGILLRVSVSEWCWLVLAIGTVWTAEALNTALEMLADATAPEFHPLVERAKDAAAGAVLIAALGAAVIGVLIFLPRLAALVMGAS